MRPYYQTDNYRKEFREENEYYVNLMKIYARHITLKRYVEIYGLEGGTERFKNQKKYKNLLKNTDKLIGKVRYNYYTAVEFNNILYYPANAVIEIPNDSRVFVNK